jgi:hypothetical protein
MIVAVPYVREFAAVFLAISPAINAGFLQAFSHPLHGEPIHCADPAVKIP